MLIIASQQPPFALQASSHSAELFRRAQWAFLAGTGIIAPGDLKVAQNTGSDLKCQVAAGQIIMPGTQGSTSGMPINISPQTSYSPVSTSFTSQGSYYGFNDAAITGISFAAANATNPRIDLVVAAVLDAQYSGSTNSWIVEVITGTPAGTPSVPAVPANCIILAKVAIAANATAVVNANITDQRPWATLGGMGGLIDSQTVTTSQTTSSNTWVDLATPGPSASVQVPPSGKVRVHMAAQMFNATAADYCQIALNLSGANTLANTGAAQQLIWGGGASANPLFGNSFIMTGLTQGITTFKMIYQSPTGGPAQFNNRQVQVEAIP